MNKLVIVMKNMVSHYHDLPILPKGIVWAGLLGLVWCLIEEFIKILKVKK